MTRCWVIALLIVVLLPASVFGDDRKGGDKPKIGARPSTQATTAKPIADAPRGDLDEAIRLDRSDRHAEAAVRFAAIADSDSPHAPEARYHLAKALYRLELYNAAVYHFAEVLAAGPKGRWFSSALEWCLFISRKVVNKDAVDEVVARASTGDFPPDYRDEFLFRLSRFHYSRALAIESGALTGALGETRVKETITGGRSLTGDIFGAEGEDEAETAPRSRDDGGLSFDDDIFGSGEVAPARPQSKPAPSKKKARAPRRGRRAAAKPVQPPVPPTPPAVASTSAEPAPKVEGELSAKDHTEAAERAVMRVSPEGKFGARAKFLEGLILYKLGRDNDALESFKSVIRLTRDQGSEADERLRELAFFQLARTHFGAKQPSFSIFYYDRIDRDSFSWLDAIYESSWAEFRLGRYEKALGNLLTLHAPFFEDRYYPESLILKAVIYYENCRYPEAKDILKDFLSRYEPVFEELKVLTSREQAPDKYYEILENLRERELAEAGSSKASIVRQILTLALSDANLERLDAAYREVDAELKHMAALPGLGQSKLAVDLEGLLGGRRSVLGRDAGRAVKRKLDQEREEIKTLIEQAIRIDVETSRAQVERIEAQLQDVETRPKDTERQFTEWTDDEKLAWPFEGEYWRDELGTYQLTLAHSCGPAAPSATGR